MARYINEFSAVSDMNGLYNAISQYLFSEGYEYVNFQNEQVFKKGKGFVTGPTFVKVFLNGGNIRIEAWLKFAVLPGVYSGEMDLTGAMGFAVKDVLRKRVQQVESIIMQYGGRPMMAPRNFAQQNQQNYQQNQQQSYAQNVQNAGNAQPPAFCTACGAKLESGAAFCSNCGSSVKQ